MFEVRTQPGGIDSITTPQLGMLQNFAQLDNGIAVNYSNVLEYLELRETQELRLVGIDYNGLTKAPVMVNEEQQNISDEEKDLDFTLYPNPAHTEVNINYTLGDGSGSSTLVMYDLTGRVIYTESLNTQQNQLTLRIDSYKAGVYMVQIVTGNGDKKVKKLIIQ